MRFPGWFSSIAGAAALAACGPDLPPTDRLPVSAVLSAEVDCTDAADDDGDRLVDCLDPDCSSVLCEELCFDGWDNNGDAWVDCDDPLCGPQCP
ncbi:MAG: hypothetical protein H0V89_07860, partial [Deltaproteobacteria bacterium]|nr:hypothetical protein [Deltaproteobacteria bacterium]